MVIMNYNYTNQYNLTTFNFIPPIRKKPKKCIKKKTKIKCYKTIWAQNHTHVDKIVIFFVVKLV